MSKVITTDMGMASRLRELTRLSQADIEVGITADKGGEVPEGGDASIADIGAYHEYGTRHIPARPWLTEGVKAADPSALMARAYLDVVGGMPAEQALARVGLAAVGAIQKTIASGLAPPLAPATIARKGSSKPLIDTGRMRQSISSRVTYRGDR